eukprot:CAMPEP_0197699904 /NCGR_PEP_ID=MMETSP1338-20131121/121245_1 /TAXON_ID=43686 ORGANISM="Pelagodinium beii, Strain RCC1491" /NCGR_SAMPLE_ID=MMETSP1338 /ASSEMBLY_ACC=CAM_ASM_000754 /LENGTH=57 /DNA_ID=CAMNT_0043283449 /DNA_START=67 /DNA_END=237 /DNA_ORIENTATION=-
MRPLLRHSLRGTEEQTAMGAAVYYFYLDSLRDSDDSETILLLQAFWEQDNVNWREQK